MTYVLHSWAPLEDFVIFVSNVPFSREFITVLFKGPLWDYVMALIMIIQRPFAGNMLCLIYYITFVTSFYSHYCYFACNFNLFILYN